jgi:lipoate-protein ligase A
MAFRALDNYKANAKKIIARRMNPLHEYSCGGLNRLLIPRYANHSRYMSTHAAGYLFNCRIGAEMTEWRLLLDGAARGAWNMAVDETLLLSLAQTGAPTLRFYDWQPSCLSLGRFQNWSEMTQNRAAASIDVDTSDAMRFGAASNADRDDAERDGADRDGADRDDDDLPFDVVRRPTGGRAVWHQAEITYCAVLREEDLPLDARSIAGAYRWLSGGFLDGLNTLGIHAALAGSKPNDNDGDAQLLNGGAKRLGSAGQTPNCFSSATRADFVVQGRKLIGAAQARRDGVVLQHGSLLLDLDEESWRRAIGGSLRDVVSLHALGVRIEKTRIIQALCAGCERALEADFTIGALSPIESDVAALLCRDKYERRSWNRQARVESAEEEMQALNHAVARLPVVV